MLIYLVAIFVLFIALLATIGYALVYFGIFDKIEVSTGAPPFEFSGAELAYKLGKGPPADSGALFTEVCSIVPGKTTIGLYLELEAVDPDNPLAERKTRNKAFSSKFNPSTDDCHFLVGVITTDSKGEATINEDDRQLLSDKGFRFTHLPGSENVVYSKFPFRGIVSVVVGIRRVYPVLLQYISEHRLCAYPAMEVYDRDTIYYMLPLSKQSQFLSLFNSETTDEAAESSEVSSGEETENDEEADEEGSTDTTNSTSSFEEL